MNNNNALALLVFAPLVGATINWLIGRRLRSEAFSGVVACAAVGVSTLLAFYVAFGPGGALRGEQPGVVLNHLWTWIEVGRFRADFGFAMDRLSGIYALFVTFIGFLIHVFAVGYMRGDKGFYRFFAYLNLFMFMMLTLILADNILLMFVGWEGVGLCSYLLIGYYFDREEAGDAAKKAFVANRVGDWGVVLGIMLLFFLTGSVSFFDKEALGVTSALSVVATMPADPFAWGTIFAGGLTSVAVLLFIGATGKSAQIPLFVWLPDAMAGPTPVSALIHAATMVTAGVYMIARCSEIYVHAPTAMFIVALIGAATALLAATIGLAQNDIKKVLAYSTVSQLGYMVLACGVGAFVAAIFHVMTHAFFKALLFLGSGSVIHGMHHEQDMRRMGGLKKYMPVTYWTMFAGWLAICGIIPFSGFFSKDEILWKTWSTHIQGIPGPMGKILWGVAALTALLTAIYMTRMMAMTFWGRERFLDVPAGGQADEARAHAHDIDEAPHTAHAPSVGDRPKHEPGVEVGDPHEPAAEAHPHTDEHDEHAHDEHGHGHGTHIPHESPKVMTIPLIVLAILATVGGFVGIPYALSSDVIPHYFERTLGPVIAHAPEAGAPAAHTAPGTETHSSPQWLSPPPQETDSGSPLSRGAGEQGAAEAPTRIQPGAGHAHTPEEIFQERVLMAVSVGLALLGIFIGWQLFGKKPLRAMPRLLENKYYVDEAYDAALINPIRAGSREGLWRFFDIGVIDGLVNGAGRLVTGFGAIIRLLQPGFVRSYAAIILLGALIVIGYFAYYSILAFIR